MKSAVAILVVILCMVGGIESIWLTLPSSGTKCVSEEIQNNVVVLGDYVVVSDDPVRSPTISVKVNSSLSLSLVQFLVSIFITVLDFSYSFCLVAENFFLEKEKLNENGFWNRNFLSRIY